jgi:[ribosomal protein S18]-alanine N-acetyltransferase
MGMRADGLWKSGQGYGSHVFPCGSADSIVSRSMPSRYNVAVPFVIRDFENDDFELLWRLDQACFSPGIAYSREELKSYMRHRGAFTLVAVEAGEEDQDKEGKAGKNSKIAGFIVVHAGPSGHVITIDVDPQAQRSGVGSLMLQVAEDRLRAAGSRAVGLETAVDNLAALSFYKRHGYSVVRTWPRYYSNGVDALVMKKELGTIR